MSYGTRAFIIYSSIIAAILLGFTIAFGVINVHSFMFVLAVILTTAFGFDATFKCMNLYIKDLEIEKINLEVELLKKEIRNLDNSGRD